MSLMYVGILLVGVAADMGLAEFLHRGEEVAARVVAVQSRAPQPVERLPARPNLAAPELPTPRGQRKPCLAA